MSRLWLLNLDFNQQVVIPENCDFQAGVPQNFTSRSAHEII